MRPEERAARRLFLRVARVLVGFVILVGLTGGALWLRAAVYPWTDRDLADVRSRHAVLHVENESGARFTLAWRRAAGAGESPGPWIALPPIPPLPEGVAEQRGFRLLAPLAGPDAGPDSGPNAGPNAGTATATDAGAMPDEAPRTAVQLRLVLAGDERLIDLTVRPADHLRLRIDASYALHMQAGHANWLGAPVFGPDVRLAEPAGDTVPPLAPSPR